MCNDPNWSALSKSWAIISIILVIWFGVGLVLEVVICAYNPTDEWDEWFSLLLYASFFVGQYILGFVLAHLSKRRGQDNWFGMNVCSVIVFIAISIVYILLNCSALFANLLAGNHGHCDEAYVLLSVQCVNVLYGIVNSILCCIVLPERNRPDREDVDSDANQDLLDP